MDRRIAVRVAILAGVILGVAFVATRGRGPQAPPTQTPQASNPARSAPEPGQAGAKIKVQILGGVQGVHNLNERIEGFKEAVGRDEIEFCKVLFNEENPGKALEDCENALKAHPDLRGIFASNAFGGAGAATAILDAENRGAIQKGQIPVVGFDTTEDILNAMDAGVVRATIAQNTELMGQLSVSKLLEFAKGYKETGAFAKPENDILDTGVTVVTPQDMAQYRHPRPPAKPAMEDLPGQMRFALVPKSIGHPYWEGIREGMEGEATKLGVKAVFLGPPEANAEEQVKIIEDFITKGYDGIAISPNDPSSVKDVIQRALAKGIAVITFDSDSPESERLLYVGTNNREAGRVAGREMLKLLGLSEG